jgi:hypothetical protein
MKEILLKLVAEIEDLRANQILLAQTAGQGIHLTNALDAKKAAMKDNRKFFKALRKEIGALP